MAKEKSPNGKVTQMGELDFEDPGLFIEEDEEGKEHRGSSAAELAREFYVFKNLNDLLVKASVSTKMKLALNGLKLRWERYGDKFAKDLLINELLMAISENREGRKEGIRAITAALIQDYAADRQEDMEDGKEKEKKKKRGLLFNRG